MTPTPWRERAVESVIRSLPNLSDGQAAVFCDAMLLVYRSLRGDHDEDAA